MKKLFLLTVLFIFTFKLTAQNCVAGNVTLSTQAQVDAFVTAHTAPNPTCNTIAGSLFIGKFSGLSDINDISGLSFLTTINGYLKILRTQLTSIQGLENITSVGTFLEIYNNNALTNVDGFSALTSISTYLQISGNDALTNVNGFSALTSISSLQISGNDALTNVDGFSNLTVVHQNLKIINNIKLTNIDALENVLFIKDDLILTGNTLLDACCVITKFLNGSNYVGGIITVSGNHTNCADIPSILVYCKTALQDSDQDGIIDSADNCPNTANNNQLDTDNDGIGDVCDNCPSIANANQLDTNNNGIGDACENATSGTNTGGVGIGTTDPKSQLEITNGDVFIKNKYRGIIMKSYSGKCYRYVPDDKGHLNGKEITCPDN